MTSMPSQSMELKAATIAAAGKMVKTSVSNTSVVRSPLPEESSEIQKKDEDGQEQIEENRTLPEESLEMQNRDAKKLEQGQEQVVENDPLPVDENNPLPEESL